MRWPWEAKPQKAKKRKRKASKIATQKVVNNLLGELSVAESLEAAAKAVTDAAKALRKGKAA